MAPFTEPYADPEVRLLHRVRSFLLAMLYEAGYQRNAGVSTGFCLLSDASAHPCCAGWTKLATERAQPAASRLQQIPPTHTQESGRKVAGSSRAGPRGLRRSAGTGYREAGACAAAPPGRVAEWVRTVLISCHQRGISVRRAAWPL